MKEFIDAREGAIPASTISARRASAASITFRWRRSSSGSSSTSTTSPTRAPAKRCRRCSAAMCRFCSRPIRRWRAPPAPSGSRCSPPTARSARRRRPTCRRFRIHPGLQLCAVRRHLCPRRHAGAVIKKIASGSDRDREGAGGDRAAREGRASSRSAAMPAEFRELLDGEIERVAKVVKAAGIKVE